MYLQVYEHIPYVCAHINIMIRIVIILLRYAHAILEHTHTRTHTHIHTYIRTTHNTHHLLSLILAVVPMRLKAMKSGFGCYNEEWVWMLGTQKMRGITFHTNKSICGSER